MVFAQDDMAHGQRQRSVRALLGVQPDIGEFRRLGVVGADDRALRPLVADLGVEMRVGRAGLRHVRAPQDDEARIVPVGAFRNVGLLAPGLRARRRQVAVPVVERHADAADERQIARARGIGDHRHGRDRREADDAVGAVGLHRIGVGRGDELVHLVPGRAHEAAMAADRDIGGAASPRPRRSKPRPRPGESLARASRHSFSRRPRIIGYFTRAPE